MEGVLDLSENKEKCIVIDVSSNFTTFGPVEKLKWKLWNHRKSYLEFKNRFNWISKEQFVENRDYTYLLCEGMNKDDLRCSLVYKKYYQINLVQYVNHMHQQIYIKITKLINQKMIIVYIKFFLREFQRYFQI